jgi:predicted RNA binding protein YcfA (HicA-like mRNA interferase family)
MNQFHLQYQKKLLIFRDKLPIISGQDLIKLLLKIDYQVHHQTGSHIILRQK